MNTTRILPVSFLALLTAFSGMTIATAQDAVDSVPSGSAIQTDSDRPAPTKMDFRGGRGAGRMMFGTMLRKIDADSDGAVTQAEIDAYRAGVVIAADTSGDGNISLEEFQTIYLELMQERMVDAFQTLDADGDGVVTEVEMDARFGNAVDRLDRNGDGVLDSTDRGGRGDHGNRGDRRG